MRRFKMAVTVVTAWLAVCAGASAQDYPSRPIKLIIGLGAGGGGDVFTRTLADEMRKSLGVPVVVENRPGGNEGIGARGCADAAPDGYTLCVLSNEVMAYNQFLFRSMPLDPAKDLQPIVGLFLNTFVLAVNPTLQVGTVAELVALSKAKPGTLSYGTFSFALVRFMNTLAKETGADIVRVPFRGGGDLVNAMLAGSTPVGLMALSNITAQVEGRRIALIAVNRKDRLPLYPNVPTFAEAGRPEEYPSSWFGLFAPVGLATPLVQRLGDEVARICAAPEFRQRMYAPRGIEPLELRDEAFVRFIAGDRVLAERIVKESGHQPQ